MMIGKPLALRFVWSALAAAGLAACTPTYYFPNVIRITPSGTSGNPAPESIGRSFSLTAVEDGYTGPFTAETVVGTCWVVQVPVVSGGAWTVAPQGSTCSKLDTEKILVKDQKGNSATTFIRGTR